MRGAERNDKGTVRLGTPAAMTAAAVCVLLASCDGNASTAAAPSGLGAGPPNAAPSGDHALPGDRAYTLYVADSYEGLPKDTKITISDLGHECIDNPLTHASFTVGEREGSSGGLSVGTVRSYAFWEACAVESSWVRWRITAQRPGGGQSQRTILIEEGAPNLVVWHYSVTCESGTLGCRGGSDTQSKDFGKQPAPPVTFSGSPGAPTLACPDVPTGTVGQRYYRISCSMSGYPTPGNVTTSGNVPPPGPHIDHTTDTLYLDWDDLDDNQLTTAGTYQFTITASNGAFPDASVPVTVTVTKP